MSAKRTVQNEIDERISSQETSFSLHGTLPTKFDELQCLPIPFNEERVRSPQMTFKKLFNKINQGCGQGHGTNYQPWLKIRRKNTSPKSNQVVAWLSPLEREAHFFSRGEYHTALLLLWLQVEDLREQYPLWPVAHPHPLCGVKNVDDDKLPWSKGLLSIAKEAGIDHGIDVTSRHPYVATMDIVTTVRVGDEVKLFTFSSKPITDPDEDIKWRTLERLELERRYALEINAKHIVATSALVPIRVAGCLEWWLDGANLQGQDALLSKAILFAEHVEKHAKHLSMGEAVRDAAEKLSLELDMAWLLFKHCAWTQKIDIDPSQPLLTSYPIIPGGRALRTRIWRRLFAGELDGYDI